MRAAGLAEVERATADGRWEAAYRQKDSPVPDDLQAALDASPVAAAFFATLSAQWTCSNRARPSTRSERPRSEAARSRTRADGSATRMWQCSGQLRPTGCRRPHVTSAPARAGAYVTNGHNRRTAAATASVPGADAVAPLRRAPPPRESPPRARLAW